MEQNDMLQNGRQKMALHEAIIFAARAHRDQLRKGTDIPYIAHPFEVAQILTENECETEVIIAGLLHDTLEDTDTSLEDILKHFGGRTAWLVQACSEDKTKTWEQRKRHTIESLSGSNDFDLLCLACADKLSNLRSIKADHDRLGEDVWKRFNRGKNQQNWYYSGLADALELLEDFDMYQEFVELVDQVFE